MDRKRKQQETDEYEKMKKKLKKQTTKDKSDTIAEMEAVVDIPYYHPLVPMLNKALPQLDI